MVELAIVGNQQQAGGVLVEPADRLHVTFAQLAAATGSSTLG